MDLATRKHNFIQELIHIDEKLFEKLEKLLKSNKKDWHNELSSDELKEIENGLNNAKNEEFISNEEVMNKFSKWH
jgi:predicted transcriptional regulator